jgi:hypothetical protein
MKSLPELGNTVTNQPNKAIGGNLKIEDELEPISKRTRSRRMLR